MYRSSVTRVKFYFSASLTNSRMMLTFMARALPQDYL